VSGALKRAMIELGIPGDRITVLRNGVDLERFRPVSRADARARLGLRGPLLASVGNLVSEKGHDLVIRAIARREGLALVIVGRGPEREHLARLAGELGVAGRVSMLDEMPQDQLRDLYSAADVLVLASSREGWPNVLLEALACGTPVVAFDVGGVPEIVADLAVGRVVTERNDTCLAAAVGDLLDSPPERARIRRYAEGFSWDAVTRGQLDLFAAAIAAHAARPAACSADAANGTA
jgi:glycosyltransferase involved in cell wall biosynthesis